MAFGGSKVGSKCTFGVALSPIEERGIAAWQEKQFFRVPKFVSPQPSHFQSVLVTRVGIGADHRGGRGRGWWGV